MIVVLDASAAAEIVLKRSKAHLLHHSVKTASWVIAPQLFISEISNVFWKYHKLAGYDIMVCEQAIEWAIALPDDYISEAELYREAFAMSCQLEHPVYDLLYLILARRHNACLLTLDRKLSKLAADNGVNVLQTLSKK